MPNRWITFVKQWASSNNIAYGCALSKPEMKAAYHKEYPKGVKKSEDNVADDNDYDSQADTVVMSDDEVSFVPAEKKKKGRPQKYKSEEEVYKAKLESNKLKRREARAAKKLQGSGHGASSKIAPTEAENQQRIIAEKLAIKKNSDDIDNLIKLVKSKKLTMREYYSYYYALTPAQQVKFNEKLRNLRSY